jgi:hypothetical protein
MKFIADSHPMYEKFLEDDVAIEFLQEMMRRVKFGEEKIEVKEVRKIQYNEYNKYGGYWRRYNGLEYKEKTWSGGYTYEQINFIFKAYFYLRLYRAGIDFLSDFFVFPKPGVF